MNIDMHCPSCKRHYMAKTEVVQMELGKINPEKLNSIKNSLGALESKMSELRNNQSSESENTEISPEVE